MKLVGTIWVTKKMTYIDCIGGSPNRNDEETATSKYINHISGMVGFVRTFPELLDNLEKGGDYPRLAGLSDNFMTLQSYNGNPQN